MPRILTDTTNADVVSTRDGRHKHDSAVVAAAAIVILGASEQCAVEVIHPVQVRITEPVNVAGDGVAEIYLVTKVRIQLDPEPVTVADGLDAVKVSAPGLTDAEVVTSSGISAPPAPMSICTLKARGQNRPLR